MQQNERQRLEDDYDDVNVESDLEEGEQVDAVVKKKPVATKKVENLSVYSGESTTVADSSESAISFNFVYYIIQKFKLSELVSE